MNKKKAAKKKSSWNPIKGAPGTVRRVPIDKLVIPEFQREEQRSHITRIANDWDWGIYQVIDVVPVNGSKYAVIDGQQRTAAAKMRGDIHSLPAMVKSAKTTEQCARVYVETNTMRKNLRPIDKFRGKVAAEDPDALTLQRLISASGRKLADHSDHGTISCVVALEHSLHWGDGMEPMWPFLTDFFRGHPWHRKVHLTVMGLQRFAMECGWDVTNEAHTKRMISVGYHAVAAEIERIHGVGTNMGAAGTASGHIRFGVNGVIRLFNTRLRSSSSKLTPLSLVT